ncbi:hypothetical protein P691DRAFT_771123 [Macrolepiota fuliginosa MF-IS2]|uniref:Rad21/Rec8-like protein N-terminal domain-containing protein n=1 Tax=Macrolepiota fuliginosa MF-IS2 TaxID=1400762 RepID=A0A9P6C6A7_9AGAR|nr:hypothetical protein P691DRAFT_771123 [Macrolepiota fuliginosa MF-IS2]
MFFTPELLSRRDSGFGLLWLAATLGSKSMFKKLPKRSVMTADIAQLCDLIAEPAEPLALRLSSNLMYGAVRVYKVKQEIFMTDVNSCVVSLKKMLQDIHQQAVADNDLLLAQPIARPHTVTVQKDPGTRHALMIDVLFSGWDEDANEEELATGDDREFDPKAGKKKKDRAKPAKESMMEAARKEMHTLNEHHDHLLFGSLEKSVEGGLDSRSGGIDISSSQMDGGFIFEDNFLGPSDGFDLAGGLCDELAKELGWEINETQPDVLNHAMDLDVPATEFGASMNFNFEPPETRDEFAASTPRKSPHKRNDKENAQPTPGEDNNQANSVASFAREFLSQDQIDAGADIERQPLADMTGDNQQTGKPERKRKRARLLLDARTELTDEELKIARAKYLESQKELRKELEQKKLEKNAGKMIEDLIWRAPRGISAKPLVRFWQNNFKVQVQARTNNIDIHLDREPPRKRIRKEKVQATTDEAENVPSSPPPLGFEPQSLGADFNVDQGLHVELFYDHDAGEIQRRSSEEPGQGRQRSRTGSIARGSQFGIEIEPKDSFGSQKSVFPWDNAGASSSANGHMFSDQVDIAQADIRLRSSPLSRRESPLLRKSRSGSILAGINGLSTAGVNSSQLFGEDNLVDDASGVGDVREDMEDSQRSEVALVTLEKNSFNFLEYAKMQHQANPGEDLKFATVVPNVSSTRHVAAAAFYHCLVLATKNLVSLKQKESYGPIAISII